MHLSLSLFQRCIWDKVQKFLKYKQKHMNKNKGKFRLEGKIVQRNVYDNMLHSLKVGPQIHLWAFWQPKWKETADPQIPN